jgi:hypothetical protein
VNQTVRQCLVELEQQNPMDQVSTTDPDSTYATKGGTPGRLGYSRQLHGGNASCVIFGGRATAVTGPMFCTK